MFSRLFESGRRGLGSGTKGGDGMGESGVGIQSPFGGHRRGWSVRRMSVPMCKYEITEVGQQNNNVDVCKLADSILVIRESSIGSYMRMHDRL